MWKIETEFSVRLGGNLYIDTPNLIVYKGESLFRIRRSDDGVLGIDFDVFDSKGQRIAKFAKNVVVYGDPSHYAINSSHDRYSVTEISSGQVIAQVQRRGVNGAELNVHVRMYLPNGFLLDAGPDGTNIGGNSMSGCVIERCGAGISID